MIIAQISPYFYPHVGGVEKFTYELSRRLNNEGHEVYVISHLHNTNLPRYEKIDGVTVIRLKPLFKLYKSVIIPHIITIIKRIKPDIVHYEGLAAGILEFDAYDAPKVMTYHNDPLLSSDALYNFLGIFYRNSFWKRNINKIDLFVSLTKYMLEKSPYLSLVPKEKLRIIPNAVDTEKFRLFNHDKYSLKESLGLEEYFVLLFVGSLERWHRYKGLEVLLRALQLIEKNDIILVVVGEGSLKSYYIRLAYRLGVANKIRFLGYVSETKLIMYYNAADAFILPSLSVENFPTVILEAMACKTPVIASDLPTIREIIKDGYNGLLFKRAEYRELSTKILQLYEDTRMIKRITENGYNEVITKYSWEKVGKQYMLLYEGLL